MVAVLQLVGVIDILCNFQHFLTEFCTPLFSVADLCCAVENMAHNSFAVGVEVGYLNCGNILAAVGVVPPAFKGNSLIGFGIAQPFGVFGELAGGQVQGNMVSYALGIFHLRKLHDPHFLVVYPFPFVENRAAML